MLYTIQQKSNYCKLLRDIQKRSFNRQECGTTAIKDLPLSTRALNILEALRIFTIADLFNVEPAVLCKTRQLGVDTLREIASLLEQIASDGSPFAPPTQIVLPIEPPVEVLPLEQALLQQLSPKTLDTLLANMPLSVRAMSAMNKEQIRTVRDCLSFGFTKLRKLRNVGRTTVRQIRESIDALEASLASNGETTLADAFNEIFSIIPPLHLPILKARYGWAEECQTLEAIGQRENLTRERIRQILAKDIKKIKQHIHKKAIRDLIGNIEDLLLKYHGILSIKDLAGSPYFATGDARKLRFTIELLIDLYRERYRSLEHYFLTTLNEEQIANLEEEILEATYSTRLPIPEDTLLKTIREKIGSISIYYLTHYLIHKQKIVISHSQVLSPGKLPLARQISLFMRDYARPLHFTEIARRYKEHFKGLTMLRTKHFERSIHACLGLSKDFMLTGPGMFLLREHFRKPSNMKELVKETRDILIALKQPTDTIYILKELKKQGVNTDDLNPYTLKTLLLEEEGFVAYRKFLVGIADLSSTYEKKSLSAIVFESLALSKTPLKLKMILNTVGKRRGSPAYVIDHLLRKDIRVIKVAPGTFALPQHIKEYDKKRAAIVEFARHWITENSRAVSSFLISEVLKATNELEDFPMGLVDHVLLTEPLFKCVSSGFYCMHQEE